MQKVRAVVAVGGTFRPAAGTASWEYVGDITHKVVGIPRAASYAELQALLANRSELDAGLSSVSIKVRRACSTSSNPGLWQHALHAKCLLTHCNPGQRLAQSSRCFGRVCHRTVWLFLPCSSKHPHWAHFGPLTVIYIHESLLKGTAVAAAVGVCSMPCLVQLAHS